MHLIASPKHEYQVGEQIGGTDVFNLYECILPDGKTGILKIAASVGHNGILDREAYILQILQEKAEKVDSKMGYQCFFPQLVESFIAPDQGDRHVIILSVSHISEQLSDLAPLEHIVSREHARVDPKTSVWIMGKLLKLLHFAHCLGITVPIFGENVLINREKHIVSIFDWSESTIASGAVPANVACEEISNAAREVITILGGDFDAGTIPADDQLDDEWYQELLFGLANGFETNAGEAHTQFYTLVRSVWPSKFHPFTAYPVSKTTTTKTTTETEEEK